MDFEENSPHQGRSNIRNIPKARQNIFLKIRTTRITKSSKYRQISAKVVNETG